MCPILQKIFNKATLLHFKSNETGPESKVSYSRSWSWSVAGARDNPLSPSSTNENQLFMHLHYCSFQYTEFFFKKAKGYLIYQLFQSAVSKLPFFLTGCLTGSKLNYFWNKAHLAREQGQKYHKTAVSCPVPEREEGFTCWPRMFGRGIGKS